MSFVKTIIYDYNIFNHSVIYQYIEKKSVGNPFLLNLGIRTFIWVFIGLAFRVNTSFSSYVDKNNKSKILSVF